MRGFWEGSLLKYGGLKPILPFLGGRSDAACRVVIRSSRLQPMEPYGLYNNAAPNRDAARHVATKTSRADMTMRAITTGKGGIR